MNEQDAFWRGDFGNEYIERNRIDWRQRIPAWDWVLGDRNPRSVLEVGCNIGSNLMAMRELDGTMKLRGVDLNAKAVQEAKEKNILDARVMGALEVGVMWPNEFDMVFTAGVLIHIPPPMLQAVMKSIVRCSRKWVVAIEYFAAEEIEVNYRGHSERLWKRDYGALYCDLGLSIIAMKDLTKADGFDDCRAWILEK